MRPQEHLGPSLSPALVGRKRLGLHYIAFWEDRNYKVRAYSISDVKIHSIRRSSDELGLARVIRLYRCNLGNDLIAALEVALRAAGKTKVMQTLSNVAEMKAVEDDLAIIVNEGVHHLDDEYKRSHVFIASQGSLDFSSPESVHAEYQRVLKATAQKLKSRSWKRVYIVPGPTTLFMQIKLLVYRICGLQSINVMQLRGETRIDLNNLRELIVDSETK